MVFFRQVLSKSQTVNMKSDQTSLPHGGVHSIRNQPDLGLFGGETHRFCGSYITPEVNMRDQNGHSLSHRIATTKLRIGQETLKPCTARQNDPLPNFPHLRRQASSGCGLTPRAMVRRCADPAWNERKVDSARSRYRHQIQKSRQKGSQKKPGEERPTSLILTINTTQTENPQDYKRKQCDANNTECSQWVY